MKLFLIFLLILGTIIIFGLGFLAFIAFSISLAAREPRKKEIRDAIIHISGCDIGKEYDIVKIDYRFGHSDRPTYVIVKIPEKFSSHFVLSPDLRRYDGIRWNEDPLETLNGNNSHVSYLSHLAWMIGGYKSIGGGNQ